MSWHMLDTAGMRWTPRLLKSAHGELLLADNEDTLSCAGEFVDRALLPR